MWDYGTDIGTSSSSDTAATAATTRLKILGIEMVYIPQGGFYAGDGKQSTSTPPSNYGFQQGNADYDPWYISSENAIHVTNCTNDGYYYTSTGCDGEDVAGADFWIPDTFPKGYDAFYLMKYEISQGQYRDFLNTLTRSQQNNRTATQTGDYYAMTAWASVQDRSHIRVPTTPGSGVITFGCDGNQNKTFNESSDGEWISMNYMSYMDFAAYTDWVALRPITELEYEKACRGKDIMPVNTEFAWGTTDITQANNTYTN